MKKRTLNLKGMTYVPDMGFRKLYSCTNCHNLQTQLPTCMICYEDDTLLNIRDKDITDRPGISESS